MVVVNGRSQSLTIVVVNGRIKGRSQILSMVAAMKRTPSTSCKFRQNNRRLLCVCALLNCSNNSFRYEFMAGLEGRLLIVCQCCCFHFCGSFFLDTNVGINAADTNFFRFFIVCGEVRLSGRNY